MIFPGAAAVTTMIGRHPHRAFLLLVGALSFQLLQNDRQSLTVDEPRYLIYAVSFIRHGRYVMPAAEWSRLSMRAVGRPSAALPTGAGGAFLMNGVYVPTLLSPIAGALSLAGVRFATLLAGISGLFWLYRLLRRVGGAATAFASLAIAAVSMPLLPYLHLFYMETFVFAVVCWAWDRLQTPRRRPAGDLLTTLIIVSIPFAHLRGGGVAALLFAGLLAILIRQRLWARASATCGLAFWPGSPSWRSTCRSTVPSPAR